MSLKKDELRREHDQLERKWLEADAVIHQAAQVAECAKDKIANGDEWAGNLLVDAVARILNTYTHNEEVSS